MIVQPQQKMTMNINKITFAIIAFVGILLMTVGCSEGKKGITYDLADYSIENCTMEAHQIDSLLIIPQGIYAYKDYIIVLEPKRNDSLLSVFSRKDFKYLFSGLSKGRAKNEMLSMRNDFFSYTDSSFFLQERNVIKEFKIENDSVLYIGKDEIKLPDVLNHVLRVGHKRYITAGITDGTGNEHFLYSNGKYEGFGDYPEPKPEGISNFYLNNSMSAGMEGKDRMWDFSRGQDLVRGYDLDGNLMETVNIANNKRKTATNAEDDYNLCYYRISWNKSHIAVMYNGVLPRNEYFSLDLSDRPWELQIWSWGGKLERRLKLDRAFSMYTLSDDNVLYAMEPDNPCVIYTYDLK